MGPVLLFPYGGPPPPIKYMNSSSITSAIGADNDTLVQQMTLDYNYGWLSLTSMGPHDISGNYSCAFQLNSRQLIISGFV